MALSAVRLQAAMKTKLGAKIDGFAAKIGSQMDPFLEALAEAVVEEITGHATVNVTSVSGVTTGPGTSGPGTGTVS